MIIKRILIFLSIATCLVVLTYQYSDQIIQWLSPLYQWTIKQFEHRFNDIQLNIQQVKGTDYLIINTNLPHTFFSNGQMLKTNQTINNVAGMPIGNVMQPLVIVLTFLLAWPATKWQVYLYRLCLMVPIVLVLMLIDMPIQLIYVSWQGFDKTLGTSIADTTWYGLWSDFLNGGGLIAMSITLGLAIISFTETKAKQSKVK